MGRNRGHICFDFDRTLAVRHSGDSIFKLGAPIAGGINLMKSFIAKGYKVKVLTARNESQFPRIVAWLAKQGITGVECTNKKDSRMDLLIDDKGVGVLENEGVSHIEIIQKLLAVIEEQNSDGPSDVDSEAFEQAMQEAVYLGGKAIAQYNDLTK